MEYKQEKGQLFRMGPKLLTLSMSIAENTNYGRKTSSFFVIYALYPVE